MKFNDILKALHSNNDSAILSVINQSIYSDLYTIKEDSLVIQTGFSYSNHNSKNFDLLYNIRNNKLINQVRIPGYCMPLICGVIYLRKNTQEKYYGSILPAVVFQYSADNERIAFAKIIQPHKYMNDSKEIDSISIIYDDKNCVLNSFTVVEHNENEISYPWNKIYNKKLYFNGDQYSFNSNFDDYYDDDD